MSDAFQNLFFPNGRPLPSGLFTKRLDLASILDAVAVKGIAEFYRGNLTQEMAAAVRKNISVSSFYYISDHEFCIAFVRNHFCPSNTIPLLTLLLLARVD